MVTKLPFSRPSQIESMTSGEMWGAFVFVLVSFWFYGLRVGLGAVVFGFCGFALCWCVGVVLGFCVCVCFGVVLENNTTPKNTVTATTAQKQINI